MEKQLGAEGKLNLGLVDGKLVIGVAYDGKGVDADANIRVDSDYFLDELAKLIPGETVVETLTIGALKMGLKNIKV